MRVRVALCHGFQGSAYYTPAACAGFVSLSVAVVLRTQSVVLRTRNPPTPFLLLRRSHTRGWGGRIRTYECGLQRPVPYRLATPQLLHHIPALVERQVRPRSAADPFRSQSCWVCHRRSRTCRPPACPARYRAPILLAWQVARRADTPMQSCPRSRLNRLSRCGAHYAGSWHDTDSTGQYALSRFPLHAPPLGYGLVAQAAASDEAKITDTMNWNV